MPVDYSKFDHIDDSDEEPSQPVALRQGAKPWEAPSFPPRTSGREDVKSKSGRETLEPVGLDEKLKIFPGADSEMNELASQMAKWAGTAGPGSLLEPAATPPAEEASDPSEPKRLCVRSDGRKKVHTTYPNGSEMVEEFDERTDVLLLRKTRKASTLGHESEWVFEVGQAPERPFDPHSDIIRTSASNPIFLRKDTPECFQWRVRNLPYPANVYSVTIDQEKQQIVVRTSNKKYFKRIDVEDLRRVGAKLQDELLSWKHQHNTLIISYVRPSEVVQSERETLKLVEKSAMKM
mmetsp:Transcript_105473/g.183452  ORF Transcript_105473/g.183452 Transcript_105473/m.183452 type:complete len:292 (-) Transcript_105473:71-946(-)